MADLSTAAQLACPQQPERGGDSQDTRSEGQRSHEVTVRILVFTPRKWGTNEGFGAEEQCNLNCMLKGSSGYRNEIVTGALSSRKLSLILPSQRSYLAGVILTHPWGSFNHIY